jgi:hypothetical protein
LVRDNEANKDTQHFGPSKKMDRGQPRTWVAACGSDWQSRAEPGRGEMMNPRVRATTVLDQPLEIYSGGRADTRCDRKAGPISRPAPLADPVCALYNGPAISATSPIHYISCYQPFDGLIAPTPLTRVYQSPSPIEHCVLFFLPLAPNSPL